MNLRRASLAIIGPLRWGLATLAGLSLIYMLLSGRVIFLPYIKTSALHKVFLLSAELSLYIGLYWTYLKNAWGEAQKGTRSDRTGRLHLCRQAHQRSSLAAQLVIASIRRKRMLELPHGDTLLRPGDSLLIVCKENGLEKTQQLCQS